MLFVWHAPNIQFEKVRPWQKVLNIANSILVGAKTGWLVTLNKSFEN